MTTCSSSGGARRVLRRRIVVCSLRSRTSRQNSHINPPLCNSLSLRPKIVSPALSQHHEGRQLKSDPRNRFVIDKAGNQDSGLFRLKLFWRPPRVLATLIHTVV